jgi:adenine deaminase
LARTHLNYIKSLKRRRELVSDVIQKKNADLVLVNGRILNVYTREITEGDIVVYGDRIGFIGDGSQFQTKQRIDVSGSFLTPGLLD